MTGQKEPFKAVTFFQTHGFGIVMTYVGDVRPADDREIIQRGHAGDDIQERIFLRNNKIVGALLINAPQHMGTYSKIIEQQDDLSDRLEQLKDPHYDIENFVKK
jgi:NAD(P)H-nitrite reductase large subunit